MFTFVKKKTTIFFINTALIRSFVEQQAFFLIVETTRNTRGWLLPHMHMRFTLQ